MVWSAAEFAALSQLLDEGLDLEHSARETWIESLVEPFPGAKPILRKMLAREIEGQTAGILETLPKLALSSSDNRGAPGADGVQPDDRIDHYRLVRLIGHGGMGEVWLAEQTTPLRRSVALKLIRAGMYDKAVVHRFQAERQSLAIMDHPAIAKVFDAGTTPQGQPYLVMEFVPGLPITEYCDQQKLKIRDRIELFIQACDGVQHAHQKAIIHRDLKPANIMVVEVDGRAAPRIIDFGLAKLTTLAVAEQSIYTQLGQFLGTPGYMSPEQADPDQQDIDTRSDIYSLGVILYVLLTGLQPFEAQRRQKPQLHEWLRQLKEDDPPSLTEKLGAIGAAAAEIARARSTDPKQLTHELRGDLNWIASKAVARERERRYGTPSDLAGDLRRYLNDEPIEARPASSAYQLHKFLRRHRLAAAIAGIVVALGLVTSAAGLIAVRQKHAAEYQASQALKAQARLLVQAAAQRLKDADVAGARGIILEVLTNPAFTQARSSDAMSVFQEMRSADVQLAVLYGHEAEATFAAYSADGTRVVTASLDGTCRVWDALTGQPLAVLSGHDGVVWSAAFSPDGTRIVTAGSDKTARIWDASNGTPLAVIAGHGERVYSAAYSPDGTRILTASLDKTARIWDARTGAPIAILTGHADRIYTAAYSPDGKRIVTAAGDKSAKIWDAHSGSALFTLSGRGHEINSAAYSPDGAYIVTASSEDTTRVWDARTGAPLATMFGNGDRANYAAYSPDGTRIVTASPDCNARIWDARSGVLLGVLSGHADSVTSAFYSPDGSRILTASYDTTARIWDARAGMPLAVLSGHDGTVNSAAYSPDGSRIVTASLDKTARTWDAATGKSQLTLEHGDRVWSAAYSPDGAHIITASFDKTARIWDAHTGVTDAVLSGHADRVFSAAYSPDGTRIVTGSLDQTARIWDSHGGTALAVLTGHTGVVYTAAYSPDGTHIVTASSDKTARIWDAHSGASLVVLSGHDDDVTSAAYSPDNAHVVTASTDTTARVWEPQTGTAIAVLSGHADVVHYAAYSPDGRYIVTASDDKTARIWDAGTGMPLAVLAGHTENVTTAVYSPDGTRIVTASVDRTARIWDSSVPASLSAQLIWAVAAQTDPLPDLTRVKLGLLPDARVRTWSHASACDAAAAAYYDPARTAPGLTQAAIVADIATSACSQDIARVGSSSRFVYEMGRASLANHDFIAAKRQFEAALLDRYVAAGIDLANLLADPATPMFDPARAAALYEKAWQDGVLIGAAALGRLYEHGAHGPVSGATRPLQPDAATAWAWYQKGADAGEPTALARFAERDDRDTLKETDPAKRSALQLRAFSYYAAACVRSGREAWPDRAWKIWRYRRASLARLLAHQGMMRQVADTYGTILAKWPMQSPTLGARIVAVFQR